IIHVAIRRGIRIAHRSLAGGISEGQKLDLDKLLDPREGIRIPRFGRWWDGHWGLPHFVRG
ncbi:hypothetical protein, partial [Rhizobium leguminosarum]|uniref:hypothetical protein n=1 Tax=Rhizobium leguminosarum TaxID=384 RepID=UPI003F95BF77